MNEVAGPAPEERPAAPPPLLGPAIARTERGRLTPAAAAVAAASPPSLADAAAAAAALGEVADRIERIAASLRRSPEALLRGGGEGGAGGDADPLELLLTGYALGYLEGASRSQP